MNLIISPAIRQKLSSKQPPVNEDDILQCFSNRTGQLLEDTREDNQTTPPTKWFIAQTDYGVNLKIVFIHRPGIGIFIRTAYAPNSEEIRIYQKYG
ncbi:TPA: hypothetical protein MIR18_19735 [Klebsiella pneumoniae]|nr:hypothetical protein C2U42_07240 [Klebsiella oxytoca]PXG94834.1 hypothetical protein DMP67_28455 [Klebsiella pneumoniae]THG62076.1 hypothetical protein E5980_16725 [Klebsiella variicola]HBP36698.1 hypothetical protein [Raoultella ornithinolytica]RAG87827.1 hypothetical protein BTU70_028275 [Klebsiella pneumoniae]